MDGLVPVVMGGGSSKTGTAGFLMAILLRSAESIGVDTRQVFSNAALLAISAEQADDIRSFPASSPVYRGIERFGARESRTPEGVVYDLPFEGPQDLSWWDKLRGRRAVRTEDSWERMRRIEERYSKSKT